MNEPTTQVSEGQQPPATPPQTSAPTTAPGTGPNAGTEERKFSQADLDAIVRDRLDRQKRAIDDQGKKAREEAEAAQLAEQQKWQQLAEQRAKRVSELEASLSERDAADLRRRVADKHKLPPALASRLAGSTEEELDADAKELAKLVRVEGEERATAPGNRSGPRPSGAPPGGDLEESKRELMRLRAPMGRL